MAGRKYYTRKDDSRNGWCIFIKDSKLISRFVAGAFESKEKADAECFRLNERSRYALSVNLKFLYRSKLRWITKYFYNLARNLRD